MKVLKEEAWNVCREFSNHRLLLANSRWYMRHVHFGVLQKKEKITIPLKALKQSKKKTDFY